MSNRLEQLEAFIKESPEDPFLHYALTMEYVKLGDDEQSRLGFDKMICDYPNYVGTYYHFGKFLESKSEKDKAEAIYKEGIMVAQQQRNMHAKGELMGALNMLLGMDDDDEC